MKPIRMPIPLSALSGTAVLVALAAAGPAMGASAQAPPGAAPATSAVSLAADIERDGACAAANPVGEVRRRLLLASGMSAAEIGRALALLSASPTVCAPIKAAAVTLAEAYPQPAGDTQAAAEPLQLPHAADAAQAQQPAGADLKFVVGAPPRRLTKGRNAGG